MNNMKKIGLSALAGSLVTFSVNAAEMSASGSAALYFSNADTKSTTNENNQWTMGDSVTMSASGELDNGMTVSLSYEIDNDDTGGGDVYDLNGGLLGSALVVPIPQNHQSARSPPYPLCVSWLARPSLLRQPGASRAS